MEFGSSSISLHLTELTKNYIFVIGPSWNGNAVGSVPHAYNFTISVFARWRIVWGVVGEVHSNSNNFLLCSDWYWSVHFRELILFRSSFVHRLNTLQCSDACCSRKSTVKPTFVSTNDSLISRYSFCLSRVFIVLGENIGSIVTSKLVQLFAHFFYFCISVSLEDFSQTCPGASDCYQLLDRRKIGKIYF